MDTTRIALISLITPSSSLPVGHHLNGAPLNPAIWTGTARVLAGLFWFRFGSRIGAVFARSFAPAAASSRHEAGPVSTESAPPPE